MNTYNLRRLRGAKNQAAYHSGSALLRTLGEVAEKLEHLYLVPYLPIDLDVMSLLPDYRQVLDSVRQSDVRRLSDLQEILAKELDRSFCILHEDCMAYIDDLGVECAHEQGKLPIS